MKKKQLLYKEGLAKEPVNYVKKTVFNKNPNSDLIVNGGYPFENIPMYPKGSLAV